MNKTWWGVLALFILIVIGLVALFAIPAPKANAPATNATTTPTMTTAASLDDLIVVTSPLPGSIVDLSKPLVVTGKARGNWYFEASFPIQVIPDEPGPGILGQTAAKAQSDWMTTEYVPFTASITFSEVPTDYYKGKPGFVILENDNPSGDPSKHKELSIPVTFK